MKKFIQIEKSVVFASANDNIVTKLNISKICKLVVGLFVVLAFIISTTDLSAAKMKATFTINGVKMSGTLEAGKTISIDPNNNVTTEPCDFTFTPNGGEPISYPCGTSVKYNGSGKIIVEVDGNEISLDFNSVEGYTFDSKNAYGITVFEVPSGTCIYNSMDNSTFSSVRNIFTSNNLISTVNKVYVIQYAIEKGVSIKQKFMFVNEQFIKGD